MSEFFDRADIFQVFFIRLKTPKFDFNRIDRRKVRLKYQKSNFNRTFMIKRTDGFLNGNFPGVFGRFL